MEFKIKEEFISSLTNIYNMEIVKFFLEFLQGEQSVLFAIKISKLNTSSTISDKLGVSRSRLTKVLNNLKRKGLVKITPDKNDKRIKIINLTEKGLEYVESKENEALSVFELYFNKMSGEKISLFTKLLNETAEIMKEVDLNDQSE